MEISGQGQRGPGAGAGTESLSFGRGSLGPQTVQGLAFLPLQDDPARHGAGGGEPWGGCQTLIEAVGLHLHPCSLLQPGSSNTPAASYSEPSPVLCPQSAGPFPMPLCDYHPVLPSTLSPGSLGQARPGAASPRAMYSLQVSLCPACLTPPPHLSSQSRLLWLSFIPRETGAGTRRAWPGSVPEGPTSSLLRGALTGSAASGTDYLERGRPCLLSCPSCMCRSAQCPSPPQGTAPPGQGCGEGALYAAL